MSNAAEEATHAAGVAVANIPTTEAELQEDSKFAAEPEEDVNSKRVTLADLSAKGTALFAQRRYEEAAEVFSEASSLQAEINGETAPENAEILFHYGRSMFKVGQSKSNVLGAAAPVEKKTGGAKPTNGKPTSQTQPEEAIVGSARESDSATAVQQIASVTGEKNETTGDGTTANKPLFQFTGDENFDDTDDEGDEAAEVEEEDEEEDELLIAFEILDLARVCYVKQLDQIREQQQEEETEGKGKDAAQETPAVRHIKERLADTHDALAEISLENEKYPNAIEDGRASLKYKLELYPEDSEVIAEAHFKLSLALEFASVTTSAPEGGAAGAGVPREDMDQGLRDEAIKEMELALKSFKLRLQNKEVELASLASPDDNDLARKSIAEMKDVIADMEQRLVDLKNGPIDTKRLLGADNVNPLGGLLGAAQVGESTAETRARVEEAKKTATDLTGLTRKKNPGANSSAEPSATPVGDSANHKRKISSNMGADGSESPKKIKVQRDDA